MIGPEQVVAEHRREMRRTGIVWLVLALVLAMTLGFAYRTDRRADHSDKDLSSSTSRVETLKGQVQANGQLAQSAKDAADEANRRLIAAGKQPVPVPTVTPISPSPTAEGVTVADVRAIVAVEIAQTPAKLTQAEITQVARIAAALVPKPADGKTPTAAELRPIVAAVLAAYCVDDKCVGKPGVEGKPGRDGRDGENGKDAPAVTDEQLLAAAKQALAAYCAQDSQPCKGPQGEPGQSVTGPTGPAGRGIADTDCQDDGTWLIYYTDGTTDTARGPCRIVIPPTKQPEN
jgi:hypothetical protein